MLIQELLALAEAQNDATDLKTRIEKKNRWDCHISVEGLGIIGMLRQGGGFGKEVNAEFWTEDFKFMHIKVASDFKDKVFGADQVAQAIYSISKGKKVELSDQTY